MRKKINKLLVVGLFITGYNNSACSQDKSLFIPKMTAINTVSYTDVIFSGQKDTVLVSTYSGRIAERIKNNPKERVISYINDEIYALAFNKAKNHIAASTLQNGVVIIDKKSGKIIAKLALIQTWALRLSYSNDYKYLFANDQRGNRFIWNVNLNYRQLSIPKNFPNGSILLAEKEIFTVVASSKITTWNYLTSDVISEKPIAITKFGDIDGSGNILNIQFNECELYNPDSGKVVFSVKHPSWLRPVESIGGEDAARTEGLAVENGYFEDPKYQMALTSAKFAKNKIFTSSIDRSIRVWDKNTGKLLTSLTGHIATVNKIKVNMNEDQVVSIDLKGGLKFWEVN